MNFYANLQRVWLFAVLVSLSLLAACTGNDEPVVLPTRVVLPDLTASETPTLHPTVTVEPTSTEVATTESDNPPTEEVEESTPDNVGGVEWDPLNEETLTDFGLLPIGEYVSLMGYFSLVVFEEGEDPIALLEDGEGNLVQVLLPLDTAENLHDHRVEISGVITEVGEKGYPRLDTSNTQPEGVELDAEESLPQGGILDFQIEGGLSGLQTYDALLEAIDSEVEGFAWTILVGNPVTGWDIEFFDEQREITVAYKIDAEGQVSVRYGSSNFRITGETIYPIYRDLIVIDSNQVYETMDISGIPEFAIPSLILSSPDATHTEWTEFGGDGSVVVDALSGN